MTLINAFLAEGAALVIVGYASFVAIVVMTAIVRRSSLPRATLVRRSRRSD